MSKPTGDVKVALMLQALSSFETPADKAASINLKCAIKKAKRRSTDNGHEAGEPAPATCEISTCTKER